MVFAMIDDNGNITVRTGGRRLLMPTNILSSNFVVSFASADLVAVEQWLTTARAAASDTNDPEWEAWAAFYHPISDDWDFGAQQNPNKNLGEMCGTLGHLLAYGIHDRYPRLPNTVVTRSSWLDESNLLSPIENDDGRTKADWITNDDFLTDLHDLAEPTPALVHLRIHNSRSAVPPPPYGYDLNPKGEITFNFTAEVTPTTDEPPQETIEATSNDRPMPDHLSVVSEDQSISSTISTDIRTRPSILSLIPRISRKASSDADVVDPSHSLQHLQVRRSVYVSNMDVGKTIKGATDVPSP